MQLSAVPGDPPLHIYPDSNLQSSLQPSPFSLFPSSHSDVKRFPSPQCSMHNSELAS